MRLAYGLFALSFAGLCGAVAIPQQESPKAEDVFKNITTLKGSKASDIIPSMQFMCASLKVDCSFCHTEDRASDTVRAKTSARHMIEMQRDINKNHFNGRNQVTCATCHAGHVHPVAVPPVAGLEVRPQRSQTVKADDVIAAFAKAVGTGGSKPAGGYVMAGTTTKDGVKSQFEVTRLDNKFVAVTKSPKGETKMGFNGTMGWFPSPKGYQSVPLMYAAEYVNMNTIYASPSSLPQLANPVAGTAKVAGKDNLVLSGLQADQTRVSLYFDKASGLLSRTSFSYPSILGNTVQINDYMNYRKVNGTMIPMTIVNHTYEGDTVQEFRSVKSDSKISDASFDAPKE